jgi:hypothetical protein
MLNDFRVKTIELGRYKVSSFEVFPEVGIVVMIDDNCEVKLFDYNKKIINQ